DIEYSTNELKDMKNSELTRIKNEMMIDDMRRLRRIRNDMIPYEEVIMDLKKNSPLTWIQSPRGYFQIQKDRARIKSEKKGGRFWFPVVFYFWGPGGSGKSGLVTKLFGDELYDKPEKGRPGSNWWNDYNGQDILFLDKFYTKLDWNSMVNVLNDGKIKVQSKYGGFEFMVAKYIFMTSTKPPKEVYNFGFKDGDDDSNKRDFEQFERRDRDKFRNMEWDIKYRNGKYNIEEIIEKGKLFTENVDGEHIIEGDVVKWRRYFPEYIKRYLRDYPRCMPLFKYRE
ncbi:7268_t:CDS:2, partial [Cetraspora pellucida]